MILHILAGTSSFRTTGAKEMLPSVVAMDNFLDFLLSGIGAALCIAAVVSAITHLLQPFITMLNQRLVVGGWARRRFLKKMRPLVVPEWLAIAVANAGWVGDVEELKNKVHREFEPPIQDLPGNTSSPSTSEILRTAGLPFTSPLRDELFMHSVQAAAKAAISHPFSNPWLFSILTVEAPEGAPGAAAAFDYVTTRNPKIAERLSLPDAGATNASAEVGATASSAGLGLRAAEEAISDAVDRALDQLQLRLMASAPWTYRMIAVLIGAFLGLTTASAIGLRGYDLFAAVGVLGGMLSTLISDALSALIKTRR